MNERELLRDLIAANPRYNATAELQARIDAALFSGDKVFVVESAPEHVAPRGLQAADSPQEVAVKGPAGAAPLVAVLREFAYEIAGIGAFDDDMLREAAMDEKESSTVKQLAPAILRARALIAKHESGQGGTAEGADWVRQLTELVDRFLSWPLPTSVCSDLCVTTRNYPHSRFGTSLLTADEARQMLEYVLKEKK